MIKLTLENMDKKQKEIYEKLLNECLNNTKNKSPKAYFLDLYTRGYFSKCSSVANLVFENL